MIWLNSFFFVICPLIEFGSFGISIINEPESPPNINSNNRPLVVVKMDKPDDDDHPMLSPFGGLPHSLLKAAAESLYDDDFEEPNEPWELPPAFNIKILKPSVHRFGSSLIFAKPVGWQPNRPLPSICSAGPSMFQSCCHQINKVLNNDNAIRQFCMHGVCCNVFTSTPSTDATTAGLTSAENVTPQLLPKISIISKQQIAVVANPTASTPVRVTPLSEDAKRPTDAKVKPSTNVLKAKIDPKSSESNDVNTKAAKTIDNELPIGEAAVVSKLQKMRGKGKPFLSREEVEVTDNTTTEVNADEEESYDPNEDEMAESGSPASAKTAKNVSKSESELKTPSKSISKSAEEEESANDEDSSGDISQSEVLSTGSTSNEASQNDEGSSSSESLSDEAESAETESKTSGSVKTYPRVFIKHRLQLINKSPKKVSILTTAAPPEVVSPAALARTSPILSESMEAIDSSTVVSSTASKNSPAETDLSEPVQTKDIAGTAQKVDTAQNAETIAKKAEELTKDTVVPKSGTVTAQKADTVASSTGICPKDRGGPNCNIGFNRYYFETLCK